MGHLFFVNFFVLLYNVLGYTCGLLVQKKSRKQFLRIGSTGFLFVKLTPLHNYSAIYNSICMNKENFPACSIINIPLCKKLNISYTESVIADILLYRTNTSTSGWCELKVDELAAFLRITRAMVYRYVARLIKRGLVERNSSRPGYFRTTLLWNRKSVFTKYQASSIEINN